MCWISGWQGRSDQSWLKMFWGRHKWHCIASIPRLHPKYTSGLALAMADTRKYWKILLPATSSDGITLVPTSFPRRISTASRHIQKSTCLRRLLERVFAFPQTTSWLNLAQTLIVTSFANPAKYQATTRKLCTWILSAVATHLNCTWSTTGRVGQCTWYLIWH